MNFEDLKIYLINLLTIGLSFSQLNAFLNTILIIISILFTYEKWKASRKK